MKKILLFLLLLSISSYSQEKEQFRTGVELLKSEKSLSYKKPKSILFEFSGHTHLIYFYKDLSEKIKKRFKKNKVIIKFNYKLTEGNLKEDLKEIPKKLYKPKKFEVLCNIKIENYKNLNVNTNERKNQFNLKMNLTKKEKMILLASFKVETLYTIATQNNEISKEIYNIISSK